MLNDERILHYDFVAANAGKIAAVSDRQRRRINHKQFCHKTHPHVKDERCLRCKPLPREMS